MTLLWQLANFSERALRDTCDEVNKVSESSLLNSELFLMHLVHVLV